MRMRFEFNAASLCHQLFEERARRHQGRVRQLQHRGRPAARASSVVTPDDDSDDVNCLSIACFPPLLSAYFIPDETLRTSVRARLVFVLLVSRLSSR